MYYMPGACKEFFLYSFFIYNSSARAIRKTALRAYYGWRRCFPHRLTLSTSAHQETDSYAGINPSPDDRWLNCYFYLLLPHCYKLIDRIAF